MAGISRRGFLKGAGLLAGGAAVGGVALSGCVPQASSDSDTVEAEVNTVVSSRPQAGEGVIPRQIDTAGTDAKPIAPVDPPTKWSSEFDVIVVGSGIGGLTAALYCAQAGKKVALLEKSYITGGASRHAAFNQINAGGGTAQSDMGYYWPKELPSGKALDAFDAKQAAAAMQSHYQYSIENTLLLRAMGEGGKWADWMSEQKDIHWNCAGYYYADVEADVGAVGGTNNVIAANSRSIDAMTENCVSAGVDVRTSTEVTALVSDDGTIVGVQIGEDYLKAENGVILCAGGFGCNLDMMEKYTPTAYMYAVQGGPTMAHTGEAIRMGVGVGADIVGYNSFCMWENGLDEYWGSGDGIFCHYLFEPTRDIVSNPYLRVDVLGNLLPFYTGAQENFVSSPFTGGGESMTASTLATPDHRSRVVFDASYSDYLDGFQQTAWGGIDRCNPPSFYPRTNEIGKEVIPHLDMDEDLQAHIDRGSVKVADTLEELAPMIGMTSDALIAAVDDWNRMVEQGEDDVLATPYLPEWLTPLKNPPYYAAVVGGQVGKTLAGLRVNPNMQVLSTEHETIGGLYAGWTTAGGICGENMLIGQFGKCSPFGSVAMSGVGGWMAARGLLGEFEA